MCIRENLENMEKHKREQSEATIIPTFYCISFQTVDQSINLYKHFKINFFLIMTVGIHTSCRNLENTEEYKEENKNHW